MALQIVFVIPRDTTNSPVWRSVTFSEDDAEALEELLRSAVNPENESTYFSMTLEGGNSKMFVPPSMLRQGILFLDTVGEPKPE